MSTIVKGDLSYRYKPGNTPGDDPKLRGVPDNSLFNRHELHEVLYMLNSLCEHGGATKKEALEAEKWIYEELPAELRGQIGVYNFLITKINKSRAIRAAIARQSKK